MGRPRTVETTAQGLLFEGLPVRLRQCAHGSPQKKRPHEEGG